MKILIAEDDLVTREMLKRILSHMADEIIEAGDGIEALEKLELEDPDFVFTDLQMPQLDGYAFVEAIRSSRTHAQMPVVCMSSVKDKNEVTALLSLGIQDYVLKPIRPAEVHDRFRKVISQHSGWRRKRGVDGRVLMLVDPDPNFREFVKPLLEGHFTLLEAVSGAHALRLFRDADVKPRLVVAAAGLPLVHEVQLATLLTRLSADTRVPAPSFWLCGDEDEMTERHAPLFQDQIRRSFIPDVFMAELRRTVLAGTSAADRLRSHFTESARRWALTATRQALGVMSGQEVSTIAARKTTPIVDGVGGRVALAADDVRVNLLVACSQEDAVALASRVLRRDATLAEAADVFGELSNTIGGRARAALIEQGFDQRLTIPEVITDFMVDPGAVWALADWFETASGNRFFVGYTIEATERDGTHGAPSVTADVADAPVSVDPERVEDVLF